MFSTFISKAFIDCQCTKLTELRLDIQNRQEHNPKNADESTCFGRALVNQVDIGIQRTASLSLK